MVSVVAESKELCVSEMVVVIRPSFMNLLGADACRAALFNHMLYWIGRKATLAPMCQDGSFDLETISWWDSYEKITAALANAWGSCKVRKEIHYLLDAGLFTLKESHSSDRTHRYSFTLKNAARLKELCQEKGVCLLHLELPSEIRHLLRIAGAFDKSISCICYKKQLHLIKSTPCNTKNSNLDLRLDSRLDSSFGGVADATPAPTVNSTPFEEKNKFSTQPESDVEKPPALEEAANEKETKGAKQASKVEKSKKPARPKIELTAEQEARAGVWRGKLRELRKHETLLAGAIMQENISIRKLVRQYTDEQVAGLLQRLLANPFSKWSKEENRFKITGTVLLAEMGPYLANLESGPPTSTLPIRQQYPSKNRQRPIPAFDADEFEKEFYPSEEEKAATRAARLEAGEQEW